jgi:hypothetical protein
MSVFGRCELWISETPTIFIIVCCSSSHNEPLKFLSFMTLCMHSPLLLPQKDSMTSIPRMGDGENKKTLSVVYYNG